MNVIVNFKDKKHSSGFIRGDQVVLYISAHLSREEQQRHIDSLTEKLLSKVKNGVQNYPPSGIKTDGDLAMLAQSINEKYYRFSFKGIRFKHQQSRWGSCSTRTRQIYISHQMINAPLELLEYLIIHELCHLKEPNHSPKYWALVAIACPDYKERRKKLREYKI